MRQTGAAFDTASAGAVHSPALKFSLRGVLSTGGLTSANANALSESTHLSAGTTIAQLRAQGEAGPLGLQSAGAADALATGFAAAARVTILVAAGFLLLGMVGAMRLRRTQPAGK